MANHSRTEQRMQPRHTLKRAGLAVAAALLAAVPAPAVAAPFGFPDTVTVFGQQVNFLYQLLTWISIGILAVVWIGLVAAIVKFRKKPGEVREPETWSHNTKLEIAWTVIPFILLVIVLVPTFQSLAYMADVPKKADLTLEVVGRQFFWEYRYPELDVKFNTTPTLGPGTGEEELYIPVNRKLKVILTSADVIHAWWVPQFGLQQMTTPGNLSMVPLEVQKTGLYEGACTYLCGPLHGAMRVRVRAVEQPEFDAWVARMAKTAKIDPIAKVGKVGMVAPPPQKPKHGEGDHGAAPGGTVDLAALKAQGAEIYSSKCAGCHGAEGLGLGAAIPPLAGAEQVTGDARELVSIIKNGLSGPITVKGQPYSGAMPAFGTQLSNEEIAAVATFVRSSFGNDAAPVLPADVH